MAGTRDVMTRGAPGADSRQRLARFALIGALCTVAFTVAYSLLRHVSGPMEANLAALSLTIGLNFAANRRFTFAASGGPLGQQALGYVCVYVLGLGAASAVLFVTLRVVESPAAWFETGLALAASFSATVVRFVLLSTLVFRPPAEASHPIAGNDAA